MEDGEWKTEGRLGTVNSAGKIYTYFDYALNLAIIYITYIVSTPENFYYHHANFDNQLIIIRMEEKENTIHLRVLDASWQNTFKLKRRLWSIMQQVCDGTDVGCEGIFKGGINVVRKVVGSEEISILYPNFSIFPISIFVYLTISPSFSIYLYLSIYINVSLNLSVYLYISLPFLFWYSP